MLRARREELSPQVRQDFIAGVLSMMPGDTLQDVLRQVHPNAADERALEIDRQTRIAADRLAAEYAGNIAVSLQMKAL